MSGAERGGGRERVGSVSTGHCPCEESPAVASSHLPLPVILSGSHCPSLPRPHALPHPLPSALPALPVPHLPAHPARPLTAIHLPPPPPPPARARSRTQGEPGKLTFQKWRSRTFELRGGSLYYYDPHDLSQPKGVISLSMRGVEILPDGHRECADPLAFVVCTPTRNWCLRAPDALTKQRWVDALRLRVGHPESPLRLLEQVVADVRFDEHLLSLARMASADDLRTRLTLTVAPSRESAAGAAARAGHQRFHHGEPHGAAHATAACPRALTLAVSTPLARTAACHLQVAWGLLTTYLGVPARGAERHDGWLQPRSELASLPWLSCDLVCRPPAAELGPGGPVTATGAGACVPPARSPCEQWSDGDALSSRAAAEEWLCSGWMLTKPQAEEGVPWRQASVQRRFCVLAGGALRCYASRDVAQEAARAAAREAARALKEAAKEAARAAAAEPAAGEALDSMGAADAAAAEAILPERASLALTSIALCTVTRVVPCRDPSASRHAFQLHSLGKDGHQITSLFEPLAAGGRRGGDGGDGDGYGGFEAADVWLRALRGALPAAAFEAARTDHLGWNHFPDPLLAHMAPLPTHPLSALPPSAELACAILSLAEWVGLADEAMSTVESAASAARAAADDGAKGGAAPAAPAAPLAARDGLLPAAACVVDLCQRRAHAWSALELALLLGALMHNTRITSLTLRGFRFGSATSLAARALGALLYRSACLQRLELRGCHFEDSALALWSSALSHNPLLPLRSIVIISADGVPRSCAWAGVAIGEALTCLRAPLMELCLDGCGITGGAMRAALEALHRHDDRFFTLSSLRALSLNSDSLHDRRTQSALTSLLRRASGLCALRLLCAAGATDRADATSAPDGGVGDACGEGGGARLGHALAGGGGALGGGGGDLVGGWLRSSATAEGVAAVLCTLLACAPPLRVLAIDGCGVASCDDATSLAVLRLASRFDSLHTLSLSATRLAVDSLCAVAAVLVHNPFRPPLTLDCSRNRLLSIGGLKLAATLHKATSLRRLDIADNDLGPAAVCALVHSLRGQPKLAHLGLARNLRTPPRRQAPPSAADAAALGDVDDYSGVDGSAAADSLAGHTSGWALGDSAGALGTCGDAGGAGGAGGGGGDGTKAAEPDARLAFRCLAALLVDPRCALHTLDISGDPNGYAVGAEVPGLLMALPKCRSLTAVDVSGHQAAHQPGALGAFLHLLRRGRALRELALHRNAFDTSALRTVLAGWRRRNLTLLRLHLFATDPRDGSRGCALAHEAIRSAAVAAELATEAEQLSRRNRRLAEAMQVVSADIAA